MHVYEEDVRDVYECVYNDISTKQEHIYIYIYIYIHYWNVCVRQSKLKTAIILRSSTQKAILKI